jgi:hypothetical protein
VVGGTDLSGPFDGAVELAHRMAESRSVEACVVSHWLSYALGVQSVPAPVLRPLVERFRATGGDLRELMVQLATSSAFRYHAPALD